MKKRIKKGFTLVELLVVIGILAVLAVVSVVGYFGFIKKANISNDVSLTTQLNTILQANETTDGKNKYPHEAVEELVDGGFDVTKFTPTTEKYNYVYDLSQNRVFLLDESYTVVAPSDLTLSTNKETVFGFASSQEEVTKFNKEGYSVYLKNTYNSDTVNTSKGVDVGENRLSYINYTNSTEFSGEVVLRTNSAYTTLTINDSTSTKINHYGKLGKLVVEECGYECYYESGTTAYAKVTKGMIVAKESGVISVLYATSPAVAAKTDGGEIKAAYCVSTDTNSGDSYTTNSNKKGGNITFEYGTEIDETSIERKGNITVAEETSTDGSFTPSRVDGKIVLNYTQNKGYDDINEAITAAKDGDIIYLFDNITTTGVITINKSIVLDGQGNTITDNSTETNKNGMEDDIVIISVNGITSGVVTIRNINLVADKVQYTGVEVYGINSGNLKSDFTLNIKDVTIDVDNKSTPNSNGGYPIKIHATAKDINVNLHNVETIGWGAIQNISEGVKLVANNCKFDTKNYLDDGNPTNYYSAVVASGYFYAESEKSPTSSNNIFIFNNCKFTATKITKNQQTVVDIRSPYNNKIYFNNCNFKCNEYYYFKVCFAAQAGNNRSEYSYDGTSRIYIDGKDVTYTDDRILNYLDGPDQYEGTYTITFKVNPFEILGDYLADEYEYDKTKESDTGDQNTTTWTFEGYVKKNKVIKKYNYTAKVVEDKSAKTWTLTVTQGSEVAESTTNAS